MKLQAEIKELTQASRIYWSLVTFAGAGILLFTLRQSFYFSPEQWAGLSGIMGLIYLAGLFPIQLPGVKTTITCGDIFIILGLLTLGVDVAVLLGSLDLFLATMRSSRRWTSRTFAAGLGAISIFVSGGFFEWLREIRFLHDAGESACLLSCLLVFALVWFLINSLLMALHTMFRQQISLVSFWWENFAWVSLTYLANASTAGLIFLGMKHFGLTALLAAGPLVAIVFATCYFYFRQADEQEKSMQQRVEAAAAQAEQARRHLDELQASEERFRSAFDYAAIGMALVSPGGEWIQVNRSLCCLLGYEHQELLGLTLHELTHKDDLPSLEQGIELLASEKAPSFETEHRYIHKNGHEVWVSVSGSLIRETDTMGRRLIFQMQDISARKWAEARLLHDAFHDTLTNLPNRALFLDHLKLAIGRNRRRKERNYAVLFMDCDRFKLINDSLGHSAGDELLVTIARRLESRLRPGDTIARLGGDEFTILLEDISDRDEVTLLAERVQKALAEPISLQGTEVTVTTSIGIALGAPEYDQPEDVLRDADTAMYHAKSGGKAQFAFFDTRMHAQVVTQLHLENDLRRAIERQEFFLVYQPLVSLETSHLVGLEALVRWRHPERGLVSPAEFIPLAEETNLIIPLGQWVLGEACRQLKQWQGQYACATNLIMNVNLSGRQLAQDNIIEMVSQTLDLVGLRASHLKLEITESVVMEKIDVAIERLAQLRGLGIKLGIDDFGTGYSSLSYLHRLPTDTLKIDRSFVINMAANNDNAEIVRTIVTLAKTLGMDVTAEGVETEEQLNQLRGLGCEVGQGFLFSRPLEAANIEPIVGSADKWKAFVLPEKRQWRKTANAMSDATGSQPA
ncbi:MAG: putative bifunctional diguanylate cyclase/phosphodiesterase [Blastocatellia bacterium]